MSVPRLTFADKLLVGLSLAVTLLTVSSGLTLFQQGGAIAQSELIDERASGLWRFADFIFWPIAFFLPLWILARHGKVQYARFWLQGPVPKIVAMIIVLAILQFCSGIEIHPGQIRIVISMVLATFIASIAIRLLPETELAKMINFFYFICFAFSFYLIFMVPSYGLSVGNEISWQGMFYHKNALGSFCATYAALAFITYRSNHLLTLINMILCLILAFGSNSFTGIAACLISVALMLLPRTIKTWLLQGKNILLPVAMIFSIWVMYLSISNFHFDIFGKDLSFTDRNLIWAFSLSGLADHPFIGQGMSSLRYQVTSGATGLYHATGQDLWTHHNGFIALLYDFGIIGGIATLFIFVQAIRRIRISGHVQYGYLSCLLVMIAMNMMEERLISFNISFMVFAMYVYMNERDLLTRNDK